MSSSIFLSIYAPPDHRRAYESGKSRCKISRVPAKFPSFSIFYVRVQHMVSNAGEGDASTTIHHIQFQASLTTMVSKITGKGYIHDRIKKKRNVLMNDVGLSAEWAPDEESLREELLAKYDDWG
ncbi:hypothetical protein L2E82_25536 [Cichorium intybus]|uniref:Uncharacterized protein n=1 Tax=Cichorium intybus TaxID=13427 RepID=A0ACB9E3V2_CICIN|nr:hypothetical protein L2E82_25536 [Cichorium intybus]